MIWTTNDPLITRSSLIRDLTALGLQAGDSVVVHSSIRAIKGSGYIAGDARTIIDALQTLLTSEGTLILPTHTGDMSDPGEWRNPPVPAEWVETIRAERPPFDPLKTPTFRVGFLPELFRTYPGVIRSGHPLLSFAAWGKHATFITSGDPTANDLGDESPTVRNAEVGGKILLLGVSHDNNTTLHVSEQTAQWEGKTPDIRQIPMLIDGVRTIVEIRTESIESGDFGKIGADYEREFPDRVHIGKVGVAESRLMDAVPLIDYARVWMEKHRPDSLKEAEEAEQN